MYMFSRIFPHIRILPSFFKIIDLTSRDVSHIIYYCDTIATVFVQLFFFHREKQLYYQRQAQTTTAEIHGKIVSKEHRISEKKPTPLCPP